MLPISTVATASFNNFSDSIEKSVGISMVFFMGCAKKLACVIYTTSVDHDH